MVKVKCPPPMSSGVARMRGPIVLGLVGLTAIYKTILVLLKDSMYAVPAEEYCPTDNPSCTRPDLFAFQMASFAGLVYCGLTGIHSWHLTKNVHTLNAPEKRLFGYLPESERLAAVNFTFQFWDFLASIFIEEHCTALMLGHHAIAAFVSWSSLESQYLHYYGVFFLGLSEFSSIFLVFVDLAKFFPPVPGSPFDLWVGICGPCFVVSFFLYRVVVWWKVLYLLWSDAAYVISKGLAEKLRPGKGYVLHLFLAVSIPMGLLQLYWFQIIVNEVVKVLTGGEEG